MENKEVKVMTMTSGCDLVDRQPKWACKLG